MKISELLLKLIEKKYYEKKEQIENKLNIFYAMNKITDEEYSDLTLKVEELYAEKIEDTEENTKDEEVIEEETKEKTEKVEE